MRLTRILLWSTGILAAAILIGCLALALFFPWDSFESGLKEALNQRIHPLHVDFARIRPVLRPGPGLEVHALRLSSTEAGHHAWLSVERLSLRPSADLEDLATRRIDLHCTAESPAFHAEPVGQGVSAAAGIAGALGQGPGPGQTGPREPGGAARPASLAALVPLPAGFTLAGVSLEIRDGSLDIAPSGALSGIQASVRLERDLSFQGTLAKGAFRWNGRNEASIRLSGDAGAEIRGTAFSDDGAWVAGTVRVDDAVVGRAARTVPIPGRLELAFRIERRPDGAVALPQCRLTGPGIKIGLHGLVRRSDAGHVFSVGDLEAAVENWRPFCSLFRPDTVAAGQLVLAAKKIEINPARLRLPEGPPDSFRPTAPGGLSLAGLRLDVTDGRLTHTHPDGRTTRLEGLAIHVKQEDRQWTATLEAADVEAGGPGPGGDALLFSGPVAVKARWSAAQESSAAILAVDLTGGRLACPHYLEKPRGVPLEAGVRARILDDEIRVGRAFLKLGETEWTLRGTVRDRADPLLDARLTTDILSLDDLGSMVPAVQRQALGGRIEIKELTVGGRLRKMRETLVLKARVAGKGLTVQGTPIQGFYLQGMYGSETLSIDPVVIQPARGMINAAFTADFSRAWRKEAGGRQYYGTLQIDHVDLDELLRLASPTLAGKADGLVDANVAFRGSGFAWPEAAEGMEAKARIYLNHLVLADENGSAGKPEGDLAGGFDRMVAEIDPEATGPHRRPPPAPNPEPRLGANRAAGWFTLRDGIVTTTNLVAVYDGKLVEIGGSIDLAGRLRVETGRLFIGGRMIPFRLDCRLGKERCRPTPDIGAMGKSAAAELAGGIQRLAEGARGVFRDLLF